MLRGDVGEATLYNPASHIKTGIQPPAPYEATEGFGAHSAADAFPAFQRWKGFTAADHTIDRNDSKTRPSG